MAKRAAGEGSIVRRKDGRWCAAIQVNGKRQYLYGKTQAEVAEKLRQLRQQVRQVGHLPEAGRMTVEEFLFEWLEQSSTRLRQTTWALYEGLIRGHINPHIGNMKLTRLTPLHLRRLYTTLTQSGLSARRLQCVHRLLHKALGDAMRWGLLSANPAAAIESPVYSPSERVYWTPEQIQRFVEGIEQGMGGQYGYLFAFLLASGCRLGEALGLEWKDFDGQAIRIERQITWIAGRTVEGPPKSKNGVRTIALPKWGIAMLKRQKVQVATWELAADEDWNHSERIFPNSIGKVPSPSDLRKSFLRLCKRLDLPPIRIHDLRHISISLLAMNGVPVKVAQKRAGHSTPAITLTIYTHVLGDGDKEAANVLDKALERSDYKR